MTTPQGASDDATDVVAAELGYTFNRGKRGFFPLFHQSHVQGVDQPMALIAIGPNNSTVTLSTVKGYVDDCITYGSTLILFWHGINGIGDNWSAAHFQELIQYIAVYHDAGLLEVVTRTEWEARRAGRRRRRW